MKKEFIKHVQNIFADDEKFANFVSREMAHRYSRVWKMALREMYKCGHIKMTFSYSDSWFEGSPKAYRRWKNGGSNKAAKKVAIYMIASKDSMVDEFRTFLDGSILEGRW